MRAGGFTSAAAFLLLLGWPCQAQTAAPAKSGEPQTLTGTGGRDVGEGKPAPDKTVPDKTHSKQGEAVTKSDAKSRVNTLSPEEQRRAARARERAAAKGGKAAKPAGGEGREKAAETAPKPAVAAPAPAKPTTGATPTPRRSASDVRQHRKSASTDNRERRANAARGRSVTSGGPGWTPRVGGVVPRGVPLYPVPPGYRPGPGYGSPIYVERPPGPYAPGAEYPPFPRIGQVYPQPFPRIRGHIDDDDDWDGGGRDRD